MMELSSRDRTMAMQEIRDAAKRSDMIIGPDTAITIGVAPDRIYDEPFRHHSSRAADGVFRQMLEMSIGRNTVGTCHIHLHRRYDDAIGEGHPPQFTGTEEQGLRIRRNRVHCLFPFCKRHHSAAARSCSGADRRRNCEKPTHKAPYAL